MTRKGNKNKSGTNNNNNKEFIPLLTRKVDQNIALRNLCKTHRTFQGLPSMGMFCLLSLIKSWFFGSFSYFGHFTT